MNTWLYCATLFETVRTNMMVNDDLAVACIFLGALVPYFVGLFCNGTLFGNATCYYHYVLEVWVCRA